MKILDVTCVVVMLAAVTGGLVASLFESLKKIIDLLVVPLIIRLHFTFAFFPVFQLLFIQIKD